MPFRRYGKSTALVRRRRRPTRRTSMFPGRSKAAYRVPPSVGAFRGEYLIRKLVYIGDSGSSFAMTSTTGALATDHIFRANDLYDPNQSGVGGQPR